MNNEADKQDSPRMTKQAKLKRMLPTLIVLGGVLVVVALALALPSRSDDAPATEPPPVSVELRTVEPIAALDDDFTLHGVVEPNRTVMVAAEVSGQIKRLGQRKTAVTWQGRTLAAGQPVAEGEPIVEGDPIVVLDTELLQAEYDRAKAQADYDAREYERMIDLLAKNVASKTEVDQTKTAMDVSAAALATEAERLKRSTILAPISGILNRLPEEVGQYVQPGMCVGEIVDMQTAKVIADVPEKDVHYLHVGDPAQILIDPLGGQAVSGEITFISELADDQTRTTPIEISVSNEQRLLRSGQIVTVQLKRQTLENVIMIPLEVVIPLEEGRVVYVASDGKAERRDVRLGFMKGAKVRVLEGLAAGDQLIVRGQRYVGPGQKVTPFADAARIAEGEPAAEESQVAEGEATTQDVQASEAAAADELMPASDQNQ